MSRSTLLVAAGLLLASCEGGAQNEGAEPKDPPAAAPATRTPAPAEAPRPVPPPLKIAAWVNGQPTTLADLAGKVVLIDFWGTTYGRCRAAMPRLQALYGKHKADGLIVIGVTEDPKADVEKFAKDFKISYPLACDTLVEGQGETLDAYRVEAIPTVWLVGRDGLVAWRGRGEELPEPLVLAELAKKPRERPTTEGGK